MIHSINDTKIYQEKKLSIHAVGLHVDTIKTITNTIYIRTFIYITIIFGINNAM